MIPVLFKEDEQVFSHNGIGALYESLSCDVIEEENGAFTMELEYPVDGELFSEIKDFRIIQAKPNDIDDPHNFRIYEIVKSIDELTVYVRANTRTNDLGNNLITNYVGKDVTPQQAMNGIKTSLIEPTNFDLISDIQTKSNVEWTRVNPLNAIVGTRGSLVDIWGGEIKRTNTAIYLYSRRGRDNVVTIRPGKNIEGLNMTVSTAGLITKILPTFTYRPVDVPKYQMVTRSDGSKEKQRVTASGSTTIRDDITVLGDVVSSQYVDNYPTNYWISVDYDDDGELKDKVDNYIDTRLSAAEDSPTIINMSGFENDLKNFVKTELDKKAKQYFTHRNPNADKPTVRISVDMLQLSDSPDWEEFKNLEQIGLTDTLDVWVEKYDIDVEVRVTSLTYDSMAERVTSFNAGSDRAPRQSAIEKKYDDLTRATNDYITSFKNGVQNVMRNTADGLNRKFEGYTEPPAELSSEGDIWFKEIGEGKVEIWIHDGVYWQPLLTEDFANKVQAEVDAAMLDAEEALLKANEVSDDINTAIQNAGFTSLPEAILEIQGKMDSDRFDREILDIVTDVNSAKTDASQALTEVQNKVDTLDFDNTIESIVGDIQESKDSAAQALTEAQKKVNTIDFDNIVNDIETGVQEAMDEAELATNTLRDSTGQLIKSQDLKVDIDGITSSLTSYAKTTDLNGLATETFVTNKGYQTAAQVSSTLGAYAKTTDLNGLVSETWVENKGYATASEVSSELSSYAKTSDLTGLATESYVTTRGYQTASQISTTLSAYEKTTSLNTKLAGKANVGDIPSLTGYAKESWVENKSYATAASVATSLKAYEKITDVNAKLADKADIDDIPDITGLASETWVENKSYATAASVTTQLSSYAKSSDLNGLASETFVTNKGYQTAAQVSTTLSSYAKSSDLTGLATETFVTSKGYQTASQISTTLTAYEKTTAVNTKLAGKANVGDIPSLTGYAKESWVENKSYATAASVTTSLKAYEKITDVDAKLANKANSSDIPSIAGLASETWVENKSYATAASVTTQLSSYAKTSQLTGLATETFVTNKGYQTAAQVTTTLKSYAKTSQLTGLATETFVTSKGYQTASQVSTTLKSYAKTTDLSGLATETYVTSRGYQTASQITTTLAAYAKTSQLSGLATETFVTNKGYQTASQVTTTLSSYVKTTTLSGYATVATVNAIKSTADTNKATISTNTGKISTIEQNVSGLQTTVASKAAQSQVTQLANSLSSTITDLSNVDVIDHSGSAGKTFRNVHTFYSGSSSVNGMVRINTPITNSAMTTIRFTGYNYLSNNSTIDLTVSFYAYNATSILSHSYTNRGDFEITNVRVGRDSSGRAVILLGVPTTNWNYASIDVEYVKVSFTTPPDSWKDGWSSAITTATTGITALTTLQGMDTQSRITQNATNINLRVSKNDVVNQINISTEGVLIGSAKNKLNVTPTTTYIANATIKTAHIDDLSVTNAKIANGTIASAKISSLDVSKISGNISNFVLSNWNSATGGNVKITGDGLESATSTLSTILKAGQITNYSGTKSGTINALGMQIYDSANGQTTKLYSEGIEFAWYDVIRRIRQNTEGLVITPVTGTGARLNSSLSLQTGPGIDKVAYVDLINPQAGSSRLEMNGTTLSLRHPNGGELDIADYAYNGRNGKINSGMFRTTTTDGRGLRMIESQINAMGGNQTIYLMPSGTGELRIGTGGSNPTLWPIRSSQFVQGSNRDSKTNIASFTQNAVDLVNELEVVSYNRKDELARGNTSKSIGFIAEDSPSIAVYNDGVTTGVDNYKMVSLAIKSVQELDARELNTNQIARTNEEKIHQLQQELSKANRRIEELEGVM